MGELRYRTTILDPFRSSSREIAPNTHSTSAWADPRAGLNAYPCREWNPGFPAHSLPPYRFSSSGSLCFFFTFFILLICIFLSFTFVNFSFYFSLIFSSIFNLYVMRSFSLRSSCIILARISQHPTLHNGQTQTGSLRTVWMHSWWRCIILTASKTESALSMIAACKSFNRCHYI
jgi:hypothetical protein